jgi:hypothetical protein
MIVGLLTAEEYIKNGKPVKIVDQPLFYEPISIAVDKGDPEFAAKIKEIIEAMRADGTLKKLSGSASASTSPRRRRAAETGRRSKRKGDTDGTDIHR